MLSSLKSPRYGLKILVGVILTPGATRSFGDTAGGTKNPIKFNLPMPIPGGGDKEGIKREVLKTMPGYENSDSGVAKFRRGSNNATYSFTLVEYQNQNRTNL